MAAQCNGNENIPLTEILQRQRLEIKTIFDACPLMIIYRDLNGKIIRANKAAAKYWNLDVKDMIGMDFRQLLPNHANEVLKDDLEIIKTNKPMLDVEYTFKTSTGYRKYVLADKIPYKNTNEEVIGVIVFAQDITEKKIQEKELARLNNQLEKSIYRSNKLAQQALEANYAKSEFIANTSHEIRTPMNAIIGFTDILLSGNLDHENKKYISMIKSESGNLLNLINDVLDVSKLEAGKMQIHIADCNIDELLENVKDLLTPLAVKKDIEFKINKTEHMPEIIQADHTRLRQCLINLAGNALKFTKTGHVYINASLEDIDNKSYIRFDIEDTGIGIAFEKQQKIFNPFTQSDSKTTSEFGGTGLGLAITKELIEMMAGEISLYSMPGQGSIFTVRLPLLKKQEQKEGHEQEENNNCSERSFSKSNKVLIAEDNSANQLLLRKLFERMQIDVTIVGDGQQAAELAESQEFSLILLDLNMPVMGGREAVKLMRQNGITTPIAALTAEIDDNSCLDRFKRYGFDDCLGKPININKLKELIANCTISH